LPVFCPSRPLILTFSPEGEKATAHGDGDAHRDHDGTSDFFLAPEGEKIKVRGNK
jgi:hypothetical protein